MLLVAASIVAAQTASKDLSRPEALRLFYAQKGWVGAMETTRLVLPDKPVAMSELQLCGRDKFYQRWVTAGLVRFAEKKECPDCLPMPGVVIELTPKGEEVIKSTCEKIRKCSYFKQYVDPFPCNGRKFMGTAWDAPLGVRKLERITGITQPAMNQATVEFDLSLADPTDLARALGFGNGSSCSVNFIRYDDGWRIDWTSFRRR